jgi:hypothetical protein
MRVITRRGAFCKSSLRWWIIGGKPDEKFIENKFKISAFLFKKYIEITKPFLAIARIDDRFVLLNEG